MNERGRRSVLWHGSFSVKERISKPETYIYRWECWGFQFHLTIHKRVLRKHASYLYIHSAPNCWCRVRRILGENTVLPTAAHWATGSPTSAKKKLILRMWKRVLKEDREKLDNHQLFSVSLMESVQKLFVWELDYTGHALFVVLTTEDNKIIGLCKLSLCFLCIMFSLSVILSHHILFGLQTSLNNLLWLCWFNILVNAVPHWQMNVAVQDTESNSQLKLVCTFY